jgi:UDPglucose 6-dehydrogenase
VATNESSNTSDESTHPLILPDLNRPISDCSFPVGTNPTKSSRARETSVSVTLMAEIVVIGSGYVGLTTGACLSHLGHQVTCTDHDWSRIALLSQGQITILEDGLEELVKSGISNGTLSFSTDIRSKVKNSEFIFLCLPTPELPDGSADLSAVKEVLEDISVSLCPQTAIIYKSTVPINSLSKMTSWVDRDDVQFISNPEFLREGTAVTDFLNPDRIVIGCSNPEIGSRVAGLYKDIDAPIVITDNCTAETIKYLSNAFLAMKISFVNEVSRFCSVVGAELDGVLTGITTDPRIGNSHLTPGPGWGGSCFPKDTKALLHTAETHGFDFSLVKATIQSNHNHIEHVSSRILREISFLGTRRKPRLAFLGVTFKAHTDDVRFSPAIQVISQIRDCVGHIAIYDPAVARTSSLWDSFHLDAYEALDGSDFGVVMTEWPEFADLDCSRVRRVMKRPVIFDTRNIIPVVEGERSGINLIRLSTPFSR